MSKSIKRFLLASVLSFATLGAALATEDPPTGAGDHNGRAELSTDTHQMLAGDGPPTGPGDGTGRAELSTDTHQMFAGGRGGISGEVLLPLDTHSMFATEGKGENGNKVITLEGTSSCAGTGRTDIPMKVVLRVLSADKHTFEMYDSSRGENMRTMEITYTKA